MKNADLLARLNPTERSTHKDPLRLKVKNSTIYINNNGGFTVAGYMNRGESKDASDPNYQVASEKIVHHVTYCYPTNLAIPTQQGFKGLVYNHNTQETEAQAPSISNITT